MSRTINTLKKFPIASWYRKGVTPKPPRLYTPTSTPLSKISFSTQEQPDGGLAKEPELGVDKLFPTDVLQAHWAAEVIACCPKWVLSCHLSHGEVTFEAPLDGLKPLVFFLRNHTHCYFQQMDMLGVADRLGEDLRFELFYGFRNLCFYNSIFVRTSIDELTHVPSLVEIHGSAECMENKAYDMYGVFFKGHPDLRRVYSDFGFQGHPMRKDFPCTGYTEMRYDDSLRRIVYEPVEMAQEMRKFSYVNPWHEDDPRQHRR